ncbi:MAG TPA: hypothetical protein EYN01_03540 [Chromatiales bacterium]|nr:hypothetical protein [Chromatiales bacterium]HIO14367.1 hypothetical protein [Chromatiales bacterium]
MAAVVLLIPSTCLAIDGLLFGMVELRSDQLDAFPQWSRVREEHRLFLGDVSACANNLSQCTDSSARDWIEFTSDHHRVDHATLQKANRFFNQWDYKNDQLNWGKEDWWTAPVIFMERSGDCEDYAIAKYFALRSIGFAADTLRIVIVRDVYRNLAHAVLLVQFDGHNYILDSLFDTVLQAADLTQYKPVYSINETHRWLHLAVMHRGSR